MRIINMKDGGVVTEAETADEIRLLDIGVNACINAINEEMAMFAEDFPGRRPDPGDFRDVGLPEAREAMELAGAGNLIEDLVNAVCCDKRVVSALDNMGI